ncbi:MAG: regulatory protein RecX [Pseudomonadota bacterium]|nr:regulatory protein RecX [Pseudomonadota bacterium]
MSKNTKDENLSSFNGAKSQHENPVDIRRSAMDLLARREHSRLELARKLHKRFSQYETIEIVLDQLVQDQLLSDKRFTEAYVSYRKRAGFGPVKIASELRERGINGKLADKFLYHNSEDWRATAAAAKQKKFGANPVNDLKEKLRQHRFLLYRGFRRHDFEDII